jgi:hypothetical protein
LIMCLCCNEGKRKLTEDRLMDSSLWLMTHFTQTHKMNEWLQSPSNYKSICVFVVFKEKNRKRLQNIHSHTTIHLKSQTPIQPWSVKN